MIELQSKQSAKTSSIDAWNRSHRMQLAGDWLFRAHAVCPKGGLSKGYDLLRRCWMPSYPETTGYTIPTLLNMGKSLDQPKYFRLALRLADYLLASATAEGGVAHWRRDSGREPIVFDTGQVIFGWLAAFEASGEKRFLQAAQRAGCWLVSVQDSSGAWTRYQHLNVTKVIDTRVSWALLRLHEHTNDDRFARAAISNLNWALKQQDIDGWFRNCAFADSDDPLTHTLAYAAEGLFECGAILGESRYVDSAGRTADAFLSCQLPDGSLKSTYDRGWRATSRSSCLSGNCQASRLWLRLCQDQDGHPYQAAAARAMHFVASTQNLTTKNPNVRGAIAGSHPIYGRYERMKYPNWAVKFFVDALLSFSSSGLEQTNSVYVG